MKKRETLRTFTEWINHSGKITSLKSEEIAKQTMKKYNKLTNEQKGEILDIIIKEINGKSAY